MTMLAQPTTLTFTPSQRRRDIVYCVPLYTDNINHINTPSTYQTQQQQWSHAAATIPSPAQSHYSDVTPTASTGSDIYTFGADEPLFDFKPQQYQSHQSNPSMQSEHNGSWLSNGQLTPTSTTRSHHHRESSLSSLGSAGPASPFTGSTSNPQVAGDFYHDFSEYNQPPSKPITPVHTPSQEQFLLHQYSSNYYPNTNLAYSMTSDGLPNSKAASNAATLMPAPDFHNNNPGRRSIASVASHDSPSTPPSYDEQRSKNAYQQPKLARTMTDAYEDELYNPSFQLSAQTSSTPTITATLSPQNDVFSQRLMAANNQHLSVSASKTPLTIPARDTSPFRRGSPLAPTGNNFNNGFGSATSMRERQKAENDARALQEQMQRTSPQQSAPSTISPKDVELEYHETEEDVNMPLFPPSQQHQSQRSPTVYRQPSMKQEPSDIDDTTSQQSYNSMATSRRPSSSAFSASSQAPQQQNSYQLTAAPSNVRLPQQYPFVPANRRQPSNLSTVEQFTPAFSSMESSNSNSNSDYTETEYTKKPSHTTADTGTYTCTYHGCTLRFETPAKLQRHKREGHRNSASATAIASDGGEDGGMTSAALRNTQNGPHKCERTNPSTGKPCNTIFSRPYDLTRHEDTIHNARKQKVRCHLCTEEKTFSRNDALTRHFRVCHPDHPDLHKTRRRNG